VTLLTFDKQSSGRRIEVESSLEAHVGAKLENKILLNFVSAVKRVVAMILLFSISSAVLELK